MRRPVAPAVVDLRAVMFGAIGVSGVDDNAWRQGAVRWFERSKPSGIRAP